MSKSLDQAAIDEAIALGIDLQFDDLYLTINDPDDIALKIKQKEGSVIIIIYTYSVIYIHKNISNIFIFSF